ncbi:methyl-accepting chemotaxis protein [Clostridium vincentii]|uniref:Methyl-accepting chemotaxis protein 3 n=1 Tax=Clostridium vincentii TaxID=52704 RepID=A0A2T0BGS2_9CLOT|nr:methyl-accepting chemotaxis protein [Clostridium vincentii]PRR83027.1 Methyl-accepting chemotaxis protein 3 [Clostridium vincentii]
MGLFTKKSIKENIETESLHPVYTKNIQDTQGLKLSDGIIDEINSLQTNSNSITLSINEVSQSVNTLSNATVKQSQEIDTAATILKDFSESMEKLAYNVTNVQIQMFDTDDLSNDGLAKIEKLDSSLSDLQSAFTISSSTVNELVSKLESVNSITDSINQIASLTNLLSLNAAIEAARAGEAGKGFSVVAGEVRKLADNSKQAVQSIAKILDEIKKDIINASNAMNSGTTAINIQQATLAETKTSFMSIKTAIDVTTTEVNDAIENLAMAAAQKDEVLNAVETANSISQEHTALAEEIAATMDVQASSIEEFNDTLSSLAKNLLK